MAGFGISFKGPGLQPLRDPYRSVAVIPQCHREPFSVETLELMAAKLVAISM